MLAILALTLVGLVLWMGVTYGVWRGLRAAGIATDFWAMVEALSTAVAAAAVLSAGYVAYRELDELSTTRYMDVTNQLFQEMNAPESVEARRWIFQHLPDDPEAGIAALSPEGRAAVKHTLNALDHAAFLTQSGWIPEAMIMPWMNPMIVKVWTKLAPYVGYERERRREPDFYQYAEELAARCQGWRGEHVPEAEITWLEDAL